MTKRIAWRVASLAAVAVAIAVTGCGSDDDTGSSAKSSKKPTLRVAIPVTEGAGFASFYVAESLGYFDEAGVDVQPIENAGGNTLPLVISGKADLMFFGVGSSMVPIAQGKPMKAIYRFAEGGLSGFVAIPSDSNVTSLQQLDGKRVGVVGASGETYGAANAYSKLAGKKGFNIVVFTDLSALLASLQSGSIDAGVGPPQWYLPVIKDGKLKQLLSPTDPKTRQLLNFHGGSAIQGVASTLDEKRDAVVKFLSAIRRAQEYLDNHSDEEIADTELKLKSFVGQKKDNLVLTIAAARVFWTTEQGRITEDSWSSALTEFPGWNLRGFEAGNPKFAYNNVIDMSYLDAAK